MCIRSCKNISLAMLIIVLISLYPVKAVDQTHLVFSLTFDSHMWFSETPNDSWTQGHNDTYELARTYYFTSPVPAYWSFVFVNVTHKDPTGNDRYIERRVLVKVYVSGTLVATQSQDAVFHDGYMEFYIPFQTAGLSSNLTVEIYSSTGDTTDGSTAQIEYTVKEVKVLMTAQEKGFTFDTRRVDITTIPQGADGTPKSLLLDKTEITLAGYTLGQGSLAFYVRWDGQPIKLFNNLDVDANGHMTFSSDSAAYQSQITLPKDQWVPVYISWQPGQMFIMISNKSQEDVFTFSGNVHITSIGSLNQGTNTLIDEIRIWDVYLTEDDILASFTSVQYGVSVGNVTISIVPEGGPTLPTLYATFMDNNYNPLRNATITKINSEVSAPSGTVYISLKSSTGAERVFYIGGLSGDVTLAYPAEEVTQLQLAQIAVPAGYNLLEVSTLSGELVFRDHVDMAASFAALPGSYYRFTLSGTNVTTFTTIKQVTGDIINLVPPNITPLINLKESQEKLSVEQDPESGVVTATYVGPRDTQVTMTITFYDANNSVLLNSSDTKTTAFWSWSFLMPPNAAYATITVKTPTYEATKTIKGQLFPHGWINDKLLPQGLLILLIATIGTFSVARKNANYAPFIMLLGLVLADYVGLITVSNVDYATLAVLAVLGLYMSREG